MRLIWIGYIIEVLILSLIKPYVTNFEGVAIIAVLVHVIFSMVILYLSDRKIRYIIILGYLLRVFILFWDLYARNIYSLPNSGADTEMFYRMSVLISNNLSMIGTTNGGMYSNILGIIFSLIGPQRVFGQYLNVLLGISTVFMLYKILENLDINTMIKRIVVIVATFFPNSIIFSAIFLREIFTTLFVSVSLYYFIKWFKKKLDSNAKEYDVIFLGRLSEQKAPLEFIDLINRVSKIKPDIQAVMVGSGILEEECKRKIEYLNLNGNIEMLGFVEKPFNILAKSKVLCMTSKWEGFDLVAIEALALGVPVIATPVGGLTELIDEKSGLLTFENEVYSNEVIKLLDSSSYLKEKSKNASNRADDLNNIDIYMSTIKKYI